MLIEARDIADFFQEQQFTKKSMVRIDRSHAARALARIPR
jgi:hypothetical protein